MTGFRIALLICVLSVISTQIPLATALITDDGGGIDEEAPNAPINLQGNRELEIPALEQHTLSVEGDGEGAMAVKQLPIDLPHSSNKRRKHVPVVENSSPQKTQRRSAGFGGGLFSFCRSGSSCKTAVLSVRDRLLARMKQSILAINRLFIKGASLDFEKFQPKLWHFTRSFIEFRCGKQKSDDKLLKAQKNETDASNFCPLLWSVLSKTPESGGNPNIEDLDLDGTQKLLEAIKNRFPGQFPCGGNKNNNHGEKKTKETTQLSVPKSVANGEAKEENGEDAVARDVEKVALGVFGQLREVPVGGLDDALRIERNGKLAKTTAKYLPRLVCALEQRLLNLNKEEKKKGEKVVESKDDWETLFHRRQKRRSHRGYKRHGGKSSGSVNTGAWIVGIILLVAFGGVFVVCVVFLHG